MDRVAQLSGGLVASKSPAFHSINHYRRTLRTGLPDRSSPASPRGEREESPVSIGRRAG